MLQRVFVKIITIYPILLYFTTEKNKKKELSPSEKLLLLRFVASNTKFGEKAARKTDPSFPPSPAGPEALHSYHAVAMSRLTLDDFAKSPVSHTMPVPRLVSTIVP